MFILQIKTGPGSPCVKGNSKLAQFFTPGTLPPPAPPPPNLAHPVAIIRSGDNQASLVSSSDVSASGDFLCLLFIQGDMCEICVLFVCCDKVFIHK